MQRQWSLPLSMRYLLRFPTANICCRAYDTESQIPTKMSHKAGTNVYQTSKFLCFLTPVPPILSSSRTLPLRESVRQSALTQGCFHNGAIDFDLHGPHHVLPTSH
ncbi:hypothetical protein ABVK25_011053 [Lepraria finkii]|uniref:Secreted protein n=1 Tax=Lepraria finkii TaxID=1340010 RepID=A0ABR4AX50_9LECA